MMDSAKEQLAGQSGLRWRWFALADMEVGRLYDLLAFRESVFVVEQACIYQELDGLDKVAHHLVVTEGGSVVACLRVIPPGSGSPGARIGRVAVSAGWRGRGIAREMIRRAVEKARSLDANGVFLNAQTYLENFYVSLGFEVCGDEYLEDGIPHIPMQLQDA